jgi:hypothetical protein
MNPSLRREIEAECAKVATSYSVFLDFRRYAELTDLFTEDAQLDLDGWLLDGQPAIRDYMFSRSNNRTNRHVCSNLLIEPVDAETATGLTYVTIYRFDANDDTERKRMPFEGPYVVGYYKDSYRKVNDRWRFSSRVLSATFMRPAYYDVWSNILK